MTNSRIEQRKQKTYKQDFDSLVKVEPKQKNKVHSETWMLHNGQCGDKHYTNCLIDEVLNPINFRIALDRVIKNKGSHGVDGMRLDELQDFLSNNEYQIFNAIRAGYYEPQPVRRMEIPKPDGGVRLLGIPTVLDRVIQQAIAQVLTPIFDPTFSNNSFGFRPGKSAHGAINTAKKYINEGNEWVVDIDLEKYFDTINHDILMSLLHKRIKDTTLLRLIRKYLNSGIMENGLVTTPDKGTPQGGPLSPLLSNIMLNELDMELTKRGHKFCRYADDCNIYVKSERAAIRVMESITLFLEDELKLKVNKSKSKVDNPWKRKFLGYSFYKSKHEEYRIRIHPKSILRIKSKIRDVLTRRRGQSIFEFIEELNRITIGWVNYYCAADMKSIASKLDGWIRRKLRVIIWKLWKTPKTRYRNLVLLGVNQEKAYEYSNTRKGLWRVSKSPITDKSITNKYLEQIGYVSLVSRYNVLTSS